MGLTGTILSASFRLKQTEAAFVLEERLAARGLDETMGAVRDVHKLAVQRCVNRLPGARAKQGGSLLMRGRFMERKAVPPRFASDPLRPAVARPLTVPVNALGVLINRLTIRVFNECYYRHGTAFSHARPVHFDRFFFPFDRMLAWNRLYGRRGFVHYQCVLPKGESSPSLRALLDRISTAR